MANEDDNYNEYNSSEWDLDTHLKKRGIPFKSINSEEPEGQFELGRMYYDVQDYKQAFYWYKKAAENGHIEAQLNLGLLYYNEKGVEQSYENAAKWFTLAAEQGDEAAQYDLAGMHYDGEGVEQNYEEAFKWYKLAAEQGHVEAQFVLGKCYFCGWGVEQDYAEAEKWFEKAVDNGYDIAEITSWFIDWDDEASEEELKHILIWYQWAADEGDMDAQNILGHRYYEGNGVEKNLNKALEYFRKYFDDNTLIIENDVVYSSDKSIIYDYCGTDIDFYEIPDFVKKICKWAFNNHVKSVSVSKDCEIEDYAFGDDVEIIRRK